MSGERLPHHASNSGRSLSEQLIERGIAAAAREHRAIDHVTARRLAGWFASRPQERPFAHGLAWFMETGSISRALKTHLRVRSRSAGPDRAQAEKLMEYIVGRGGEIGPVGEHFGASCDQLDRAEVMLAAAVERAKQRIGPPEPTWPERSGPPVVALAHRQVESGNVSLLLDPTTANLAMFAVAALAIEREAHRRELESAAERLPEASYGRANRNAMAAREGRIAERLRAIQRAYLAATEEVVVLVPPTSSLPPRSQEIEPEAE